MDPALEAMKRALKRAGLEAHDVRPGAKPETDPMMWPDRKEKPSQKEKPSPRRSP